ncbi:MAG: hypothetical protein QM493_09935 [Sulfurovum sp.]
MTKTILSLVVATILTKPKFKFVQPVVPDMRCNIIVIDAHSLKTLITFTRLYNTNE